MPYLLVQRSRETPKARKFFEDNTDKVPDDERPKPMTAKEW